MVPVHRAEGNTLVLKQVERLTDGVAVGNRELREYTEVRGYATAAPWVYCQAITPISSPTPTSGGWPAPYGDSDDPPRCDPALRDGQFHPGNMVPCAHNRA